MMVEMADFIVVADSVWNSTEGRFYFKDQTISLPASTKVSAGSSVQPVEAGKPKKSKPEKSDDLV